MMDKAKDCQGLRASPCVFQDLLNTSLVAG